MTDLPRISVIIPTYNRASLLERTIASVERQTLAPIEILLIDDCSTDDTQQRIAGISSTIPIVYHRLAKNGGGAVARNAGIRLAKGDYVAFLDSDDEWEIDHLKTLASYTLHQTGDFVVASSAIISEKGIILPKDAFQQDSTIAQKLHFVLTGSLAFQTSTLLMPRIPPKIHVDGRLLLSVDPIFRMIRARQRVYSEPDRDLSSSDRANVSLGLHHAVYVSCPVPGAMSRKSVPVSSRSKSARPVMSTRYAR